MIATCMLLALVQRPPVVPPGVTPEAQPPTETVEAPQEPVESGEPEAPVSAPAEEPEPPPPAAPAEPVDELREAGELQGPELFGPGSWRPLAGVALLVNDECVTSNDIQRAVFRSGRPVTNRQEELQQAREVTTQLTKDRLKAQAGRDMGFDPDMVQRFVSDHMRRTKQAAGSAGRLADQLANTDFDAVSFHENIESTVLQDLWTGAIVGRYPGVGGRVFRDRHVRPSRLKFEFERQEGNLDLPSTVKLQEMVFDPKFSGDITAARELADRVREEVLEGGDFGELAVMNNAANPRTMGVYDEPFDERQISQIVDIGEFLADAEPGDVSEVMPVREEGVLRAWRILKLLERNEPQVAEFQDAEVQSELRRLYLRALDRGREEEALGELLDAAYVWPPATFGREEDRTAEKPKPREGQNEGS